MSLEDNTTCALCLVDFIDGNEVRPVHPTQGLVFPTSHTFPDAINIFGFRMEGKCRDDHKEPHIHEKCINGWEDKFNLETPKTREEARKTAGMPKVAAFGLLGQISGLDENEIDNSFERALLEEQELEDEKEDCPLSCPHKLDEHWEITAQVLKCKHCECTF